MSEIPHPNITRLVVKNYRSLKEIDVRLQPLTVLVGENGSGKSNLIDVLRFVRDALTDGFQQAVEMRGGMDALRCWFAEKGEPISIQLEFEGAEWAGEYAFAFDKRHAGVELLAERLELTTNDSALKRTFEVVDGAVTQASLPVTGKASNKSLYLATVAPHLPAVQAAHDFLAKMNFYELNPKDLRLPQPPRPPFPLSETGDNLASTLLELQISRSDWMIRAFLEVIAEGLVGIGVEQVNGHLVTKLHYTYSKGAQPGMIQNGHKQCISSELKDQADGTIQLLALLTALYQKRYPSPLVVENPEKAIYSRSLDVCSDAVKATRRRYQILVTTHSPHLIDGFPAESFLILEKEAGITKIGPLSCEQQEAIADNVFSLGELMQIEGLYREGASW